MKTLSRKFFVCVLAATILGSPVAVNAGEWWQSPEGVAREFIAALDHLDLDRIIATQAPDATMFFPQTDATYRLDGRDAIQARMRIAFDAWKNYAAVESPGTPLRLNLPEPVALKVQLVNDGAAVVTWMFDRPGNFGRRTAVVRLTDDGWRMVSFHSSNLGGK